MAPQTPTDLLTAAEHITVRREDVAAGLTAPQPAWERSSSDIGMMKVLTQTTISGATAQMNLTSTMQAKPMGRAPSRNHVTAPL
jgi:hypothetical protein